MCEGEQRTNGGLIPLKGSRRTNGGREVGADTDPRAKGDHRLLLLSKVQSTEACPAGAVKHAIHFSVLFMSVECKGRGSVCCCEGGPLSRGS